MNDNPFVINQVDTVGLNRFFAKIYGFVAAGIGLSAVTSFLALTVFRQATINLLVGGGAGFIMILMLAEIGLVFAASAMANKSFLVVAPITAITTNISAEDKKALNTAV